MGELLPYLPYDSAAIRSVASTLRTHAAQIATAGSTIAGAGGSMTFDGPAGDRLRQALADCGRDASRAGDGLQSASGQLERTADDVDAQNAAIGRHNEAVLRDLSPVERKLVLRNR